MDSQIIDAVTGWETVPVSAGYEGLHQLADDGFSGAVSSGTTWAFVLNGRFIGVFEGDIESFDGAELTAYRAPDPALSLLYTMQETGGETRASYYTNNTPLADADETLSSGGFTGYVELSENVLSGDYYVVYYGGKSMSAAFVGSSERLVTGDDAFERANDEVGIYEVKEADISIVDLPELASDDEPASVAADEAADDASDVADDPTPETAADEREDEAAADSASAETPAPEASEAGEDPVRPDPDADAGDEDPRDADPAEAETPDPTTADGDAPAADSASPTEPTASTEASNAQAQSDALADPQSEAAAATATEKTGDDPFSAEEKWREARSIPSLDPSESSTQNGESGVGAPTAQKQRDKPSKRQQKRRKQRQEAQERRRREEQRAKRRREEAAAAAEETAKEASESAEAVAELRDQLDEAESRRDELASERDELEAERDEFRDRAEQLEARVETLETEIDRLESQLEAANGGFVAEESMSPQNALSGTNLFVRYQRKGQATLEHAHDGQASRQEVIDNLRLEHHTTFDTEGLAVEDRPYEEFLHDSTEYGFAKWVVTDLLYEIGETGNRNALADLFDALPRIDRIELHGVVGFQTEEGVEDRAFDVIFRDQMGDALFVADMNTSRNAATEAMVASLVGNARAVAESDDALATAFYVTESFFEPEALEKVAEETGGGFLSRSKRKSFVKLSRKQGFHVCLVEARNNEFHVNVPDL